ncbi:Polyketide synthase PksN [Durusdinium trenchii]|uniref:Polyketide synthase PksN n=1 Tax=Durusdinium trenchii TaxID=1381693 RepID=A0ABP0KIH5_9DINO
MGLDAAVECLVAKNLGSVVFLDETAEEDWSWAAPQLPEAVCLGVHEDFDAEVQAVRRAVGSRACAAQLGPVALHSSACLHILSSVRVGHAQKPLAPVRPAVVQLSSAPRAASARNFRRALPRRQPLRFLLQLDGHPLATPAIRAEVHQAIVAACLVSKSVYDERDTKLLLAWHEPAEPEGRALTVDRSLLGLSKARLVPSESQVLEALQVTLQLEAASLQRSVEDLLDEAARLSFRPPVVVKVSQLFEDSEELPKWKSQRSWPTDPPIFLCINWFAIMSASLRILRFKAGSPAKIIVTLQHWHNLGVLPATVTPRPALPSRSEEELEKDLARLVPQPGKDVHLNAPVSFKGRVIGRVRMGHVLFAECGKAKVMCKEQRLQSSFHVAINELRVGDTLYCTGYPGFEYKCEPVIFATELLAIEPGSEQRESTMRFRDDDLLVIEKPAGKLAWEDNRHRNERGTAVKVDADNLLMAPEIEVSGPAVYAFEQLAITHCALEYTVLVAGSPREVSSISAALRPARGKPKEDAETLLEMLWQGEDCSLLKATVNGTEVKSQVCRHLHILGFPVWGDRRFGNQRANLRSRAVFGLARPWCHLTRLELCGSWGGLLCESQPPSDLMRVLAAVGCVWTFPSTFCKRPPLSDLSHLEQGLSISYYSVIRPRWKKSAFKLKSDS